MRPLARWGTLPLLAAPIGTWALGLGDIEPHSALNQPFNAEIALVSATPEELAGLRVSLASPETFDRLRIERPGFLSSLEFDVSTNAAGENVISVRSSQSITEPFVTILVRATWPRGELMREYTVFLDPPVLLPEPPAPAAIQSPQTRAPQQTVAGGAISRAPEPATPPAPRPTPAPAPRAATPAPTQTPTQAPAPTQARAPGPEASADGSTYGPVQNAETLWGISTLYRPTGVSMNQMMLAVYEANPQAFAGNMNHLRRGAILRIPPMSALQSTTTAAATAEVRRQEIEWQERRAARQPEARLVLVPPADEPVSTGAGANAAAGAEVSALRNEISSLERQLTENERLLALRDTELADLQARLSAQSDTPQPTPVEDAAASGDAELVAETSVEPDADQLFVDDSGDEPAVEPPAEPVAAETPAEPAPIAAQTPTPAAGPSLVERILGIIMSPLVLIGVGIGAVLIAALLFLRRRREEVEDVTGQWEALEAEVDDAEDEHAATTRLRPRSEPKDDFVVVEGTSEEADALGATFAGAGPNFESATAEIEALTEPEPAEQTLSSQTVINLDQADPIAEADFHMAYGLYDQAADLVGKALEADPGNRELKLKLLEVFFVWGNKEQFLHTATSLREEMGGAPDGDWDKVIIMGKQICPDEALFADAKAAAGEVDLDLEAGDTQGLDLTFDEDDSDDVDLDFGTMAEGEIELESTGGRLVELDSTSGYDDDEITGRHERVDDADDDMLEIGARTSAGLEAALFETDAAGEETSPDIDLDNLDATQESPTIESRRIESEDELDWTGITMESPTVEQAGPESPTLESTALQNGEAPTVETPTIETETPDPTRELSAGQDATAELDLDDLGLDVADIDGLPGDLGDLPAAVSADSDTREQPAIDGDDDLLSATGVTEVLRGDADEDDIVHTKTAVLGDDEATMMAPSLDATGVTTEVLDQPVAIPGEYDDDDDGLDLNLDDLTLALRGGDTVEQPRASSFDTGMFDGGASSTPVDLDIGADLSGDDEPTGTEEVSPLDPQTMTEVGTKLDLARAYIDMGDPDGAKSILEEVLSEGDTTQRQEAQSLIDALPA